MNDVYGDIININSDKTSNQDITNDDAANEVKLGKAADPIEVNFLDDSKSEIIVKDTGNNSRIEAVRLSEGFYLVTRLVIPMLERHKDSDRRMLTKLREFSVENKISIIYTDVGKYGYSDWTTHRNTAVDSGFQLLGGKQRGITAAGYPIAITMTQTDLKSKIYEINKLKELSMGTHE